MKLERDSSAILYIVWALIMPTKGSLSKTALAKEVSGEHQEVTMEGEVIQATKVHSLP